MKNFLNNLGVDVDGATFDELQEIVERYISEEEVIYYSNAVKILETRLTDAIELAESMGYDMWDIIKNLPDYDIKCSELLATMIIQEDLTQEWNDFDEDDYDKMMEEGEDS